MFELEPGRCKRDRKIVRLFTSQFLQSVGEQFCTDLFFRKRIDQIEQLAFDRTCVFRFFAVVGNVLAIDQSIVQRLAVSIPLTHKTDLQIESSFTRTRLFANSNNFFCQICSITFCQSSRERLCVETVDLGRTITAPVIAPGTEQLIIVHQTLNDRDSICRAVNFQELLCNPLL